MTTRLYFFYSDHGGALPWMKREVLERGTHIPFIIHFPNGKDSGTVNDDLTSAVDFAPTMLSLAGIPIPSYMQGQAFLGAQKSKSPRKYVFAGRDRMDTEYDRVRMVRDKEFQYLYNYMPDQPYYQNIEYRLGIPMMKEFLKLRDEGKLDSIQMAWFKNKPVEELYDVRNDPHEIHNLAGDPQYRSKLLELRTVFQSWTKTVGDMSRMPEKEMIRQMWNGGNEPPVTAIPEIAKTTHGVKLSCQTKGASIGYQIHKKGTVQKTEWHTIQSWDFGMVFHITKNGDKRMATPGWQVYHGEVISLQPNDTLIVNAMRIGYKPALTDYISR